MRVSHKMIVKIGDDADYKDLLFSTDPTLAETVADGFLRQASGRLNVAAAATEDVPFGDVDAVKALYLKVDADCIVKLNGGVEEIQLRKHDTVTTGTSAKLFLEADLSQVEITAPADSAVNAVYCVWGDPST